MLVYNPKKPRRYVLNVEKNLPEEQRTVFLLKVLTVEERDQLHASFVKAKKENTDNIDYMKLNRECVSLGLVGWENAKDEDGEEIPFDKDTAFNCLMDDTILSLTLAIKHGSELTEQDKKN